MSGGSEPYGGAPVRGVQADCVGPITRLPQRGRPGTILTTRVGLQIPVGLTFDGWERAGHQLSRVVDAAAWCLGDWLVYGQARYADRYRRAVAEAGLDYQTLRNYAWVARRFELFRRRVELSFQHHAEVAALPPDEQDRWLERAASLRWSRNQLRQSVRDRREVDANGGHTRVVLPRMQVSQQTVERWQRAAQQSRTDLHRWVVETLDSAAARALSDPDDAAAHRDDLTAVRS